MDDNSKDRPDGTMYPSTAGGVKCFVDIRTVEKGDWLLRARTVGRCIEPNEYPEFDLLDCVRETIWHHCTNSGVDERAIATWREFVRAVEAEIAAL